MRLSRPCYDKYHRCPGWAGGGLTAARVDRCEGGYIAREAHAAGTWSRWRGYGCTDCDVIVLPSVIRWVDPTWLADRVRVHGRRMVDRRVDYPDGTEWLDLWGLPHDTLREAVAADLRHLVGRQ